MIYIQIFLFAVILFALLKFTAYLLPLLPAGKKVKSYIIRGFSILELLLWLLFIIKSANLMFSNLGTYPVIMSAIILAIVVIIAWYFLRDFIAGALLKGENGFEPGMEIVTPLCEGTIVKSGYRSLEIITHKGENVKVPYTLISKSTITRPAGVSRRVEHHVKLEFSSNMEISRVKSIIKKRVLEMPWITSEKNINVEILMQNEGEYIADLKFYSLSNETAAKTEETLRKYLSEIE